MHIIVTPTGKVQQLLPTNEMSRSWLYDDYAAPLADDHTIVFTVYVVPVNSPLAKIVKAFQFRIEATASNIELTVTSQGQEITTDSIVPDEDNALMKLIGRAIYNLYDQFGFTEWRVCCDDWYDTEVLLDMYSMSDKYYFNSPIIGLHCAHVNDGPIYIYDDDYKPSKDELFSKDWVTIFSPDSEEVNS